MTSGRIILIENEKEKLQVHYSCEFNGDMEPYNDGMEILLNLEKINKSKIFENFIFFFNNEHYGNPDNYTSVTLKEIRINELNLTKNLHCDYLYIKNISSHDIKINNKNKEIKTIKPNEIIVLEKEKYIDLKEKLKDYYSVFEED